MTDQMAGDTLAESKDTTVVVQRSVSQPVKEVWRLLDACTHTWHRLLLATTYAAGLRVSEVVALKVSDLDADRMTVRVQQGKGMKDRYVPLAKRLLHDFRVSWKTAPPGLWLFPNRQRTRPIDITVMDVMRVANVPAMACRSGALACGFSAANRLALPLSRLTCTCRPLPAMSR